MDARSEPTPFDQRLFFIFIVTFATMTVFEFAGYYVYLYPPEWRSNLITSLFTSGLAVIIAYFPLKAYYDMNTQLLSEVVRRHGVEMELREQKEHLKKTNKKLTMLSTITRHDIKNTLTGLVGFLQLVKNEAPDNPSLNEHLNKVMECSETIEQQIEFTRDYEEL
ncbi:MAG: histidine kinase dimerization/phospho-acceptor domain-containing protein [Methanoregula sp.]|uniref:histidine kinase dimerization/phospho-acceptor domain-containing protein n=1 Tax=Methanoregula sp. TaxID=2052170 RepID=UPI003C459617